MPADATHPRHAAVLHLRADEDEKATSNRIAALFLATGTAHAMQHDMSNTWCAKNIPKHAMVDREHYYTWIEKCHARRGTKPRWGLPRAEEKTPSRAN